MSFSTTYTDGSIALVLSNLTPGSLTKSPREKLMLGDPGEPDRLQLCYEGLISTTEDVASSYAVGTDMSTPARYAGTWYAERAVPKFNGPFVQVYVDCVGLYTSKPNRVRYLSTVENQNAENVTISSTVYPKVDARILSVGCEIDTVLVGSSPDMSAVGDNVTPSPAPSVRSSDWTSIADPVYHYRNGWVLDDIRTQNLAGLTNVWLATYVYSYVYPWSP